MKALVMIGVVAASIALSGCSTLAGLLTPSNIHKGCEEAIKGAHTVQDIAVILQRHGLSAADANKIANHAATGELLITQVCIVADAVLAERTHVDTATIALR